MSDRKIKEQRMNAIGIGLIATLLILLTSPVVAAVVGGHDAVLEGFGAGAYLSLILDLAIATFQVWREDHS